MPFDKIFNRAYKIRKNVERKKSNLHHNIKKQQQYKTHIKRPNEMWKKNV